MISMLFQLAPVTITSENITVTFPSGWRPGTPSGMNIVCDEAGLDCLLSATSGSLAVFTMNRYSGADVANSSLEQWNADIEAEIERSGGELLSQSDAQIDGRDAVRNTLRVDQITLLATFIRDGDSIVAIVVNLPIADESEFTRYLSEIDPIIDSIDFADS